MVGGEAACIGHALYGMVAAAPFGDVVEEGGKVEQVFFVEGVHDGGGEGQFVHVLFHCQAAHVPQDGEDVVVHGVDVEQVVLQQADDFVPFGQIAAEYTVEVEEAHGAGQAAPVSEKTDKAAAVGFVFVEGTVDFSRRRPPGAQGFRRDGGQVAVPLQQFDDDENVFGLLFEQVFVTDGDLVADLVIVAVDGPFHARQRRVHAPAQHRQDDAVELFDRFGRAVEAVHQFFAFQTASFSVGQDVFRQTGLQVEYQAVFFAACGQVQVDADGGQFAVAVGEDAGFGAGEDALADECVKTGIDALRLGQPEHGVDVAQAAGAGFDVRFEQCAGALLFVVALLHFEQFAFDKGGGVALGV